MSCFWHIWKMANKFQKYFFHNYLVFATYPLTNQAVFLTYLTGGGGGGFFSNKDPRCCIWYLWIGLGPLYSYQPKMNTNNFHMTS